MKKDDFTSTISEGSAFQVLEMLDFVAEEVGKEKDVLIGNEQSAQSSFEEEMQGLEAEETTLIQNLDQYKLNKANQEKAIEEAHDDVFRLSRLFVGRFDIYQFTFSR